MNDAQIGRIVSKVLVRLKSYKHLQESIAMEHSMCNHYGVPFNLPVERLTAKCVEQAARAVASWLDIDVGEIVDYYEGYSRGKHFVDRNLHSISRLQARLTN